MYCKQCGRQLPAESRFCNHCGAAVGDGIERDQERIIFRLRPTLIFVAIWYLMAAAVLLVAAAVAGMLKSQGALNGNQALLLILIVALVAFSVPAYKHILWHREVYTLTNHKLEMRYGLIAKTIRNIPLRNIQDVTVTSSIWERLINIGDIVIDSASESGKIRLSNIHRPERYADMILEELRRLSLR
jgi:uncharacterized membrane protein YdbT with pleckstrin-like domain